MPKYKVCIELKPSRYKMLRKVIDVAIEDYTRSINSGYGGDLYPKELSYIKEILNLIEEGSTRIED